MFLQDHYCYRFNAVELLHCPSGLSHVLLKAGTPLTELQDTSWLQRLSKYVIIKAACFEVAVIPQK